jgi:hypothetical protein
MQASGLRFRDAAETTITWSALMVISTASRERTEPAAGSGLDRPVKRKRRRAARGDGRTPTSRNGISPARSAPNSPISQTDPRTRCPASGPPSLRRSSHYSPKQV